MTPRSLLATFACALPLLLVGPTATAAPAAAEGAAPATQPGWYLADVVHDPTGKGGRPTTQRLVVVSPTGETTTVHERRVSRKYGGFRLLDWSADGRTALITATRKDGARVIRVDVATGAAQELRVPLLQTAILDPDGSGVLATSWPSRRSNTLVLHHIDWTGERTRLREGVGGTLIAGRDGTVISVGAKGRQWVLDANDGSVVDTFQRRRGHCSPVRWWDATRLLQWCGTKANLFLVDPASGATTRLTRDHGRGDYGHLDGRLAGGRLYVQVAGGCGYTYVGRQTDGGEVKHLRVPGAGTSSVNLIGTVEDDLVIEHTASCEADRERSVLARFDPVRHVETPLVVLGRNQSFGRILVHGEVRASTW